MKIISWLFFAVIMFNAQASTEASVDPAKALRMIKNGNIRFVKHNLRNDGQSKKDIMRLSEGQKPHSIVLSCSDSRIPPELVFDQKLGEIFVVRTAGQSLDDNAIGSIEYALEHLGAALIIVMGHTSCGAVKAAHSTLDGSSLGTTSLDALVHDLHPRLQSFKSKKASNDYESESWANVQGVTADLVTRSKLIAEKLAKNKIMIVPAMYHLNSGAVTFRDEYRTSKVK